MKKIAILTMSLFIVGAVFAQTPQAPAKKEATKTEKKCCSEKKCDEKKGDKKACCEKKGDKKACCADKKAETSKK
jgi:hypothetical protein